jgi:hypothetical protein
MVKKALITLAVVLTTAALCSAQNDMEFFQTTGPPLGYNHIGNVVTPGEWLTGEVWVTTGFWTNKVAVVIDEANKNVTCVTFNGDCALTDTQDIGLRCIAYCPHPGQLVVNIGPQVMCNETVSGAGCSNSAIPLCNGHCPYPDGSATTFIYPWVQGRTWIARGLYAEETASSSTTPANTPQAAAETSGTYQIRLWQTHSNPSDKSKYIQSVGLPHKSSILPRYAPATEQADAHVVTLSMYDDAPAPPAQEPEQSEVQISIRGRAPK